MHLVQSKHEKYFLIEPEIYFWENVWFYLLRDWIKACGSVALTRSDDFLLNIVNSTTLCAFLHWKKQIKCHIHTFVIHKLSAAESKLTLLLKKFTLFSEICEWKSTWRQKESQLTTTLNRDNYSKMLTENTWYNMSVNMKSESLKCHDSNSRFSVWLTINVITLSIHQSVCFSISNLQILTFRTLLMWGILHTEIQNAFYFQVAHWAS